jgi:predicted nucleic acid-binding protein
MTATVFVDTNVLIYALDPSDPKKYSAAQVWRSELWRTHRGRVSIQVLQEFYVKAAQKWPKSRDQVRAEVQDLLAWNPVSMDYPLIELGWRLQDRFQLSFWDALIVAAAKTVGSRHLLTEDLQPGQNLDGVHVTNPFQTDPSAILS